MTPDAAGIEAALAAGLAAHWGTSSDLTTPRQYTAHGGWNTACECGQHLCSHSGECDCHRAHVAAALLPVVTQAQAEAWDAGYATCYDDARYEPGYGMGNPYHARADESGAR